MSASGSPHAPTEGEESERLPLLLGPRAPASLSSVSAPPPRPAYWRPRPAADVLPFDLWHRITEFVARPAPNRAAAQPFTPEEIREALVFSQISQLHREVVVRFWEPNWTENIPVAGPCCWGASGTLDPHIVVAQATYIYSVKCKAAGRLRDAARNSAGTAFNLLVAAAQWTYLALFLPTVLTLLGLMRPSWRLWTVATTAVLFVPLISLGGQSIYATLRWWDETNPQGWAVPPRPFHLCNPIPWVRVVVLFVSTMLVGFGLAAGSWELGAWLDSLPFQETQWVLVVLMICCYCP
eukprot:Hpha_TRINITY_DN14727_c0_g3::TRINITY_DN14727_c0_g3_i1::g.102459::m.102459